MQELSSELNAQLGTNKSNVSAAAVGEKQYDSALRLAGKP
jgi:hypothetical protein